MKKLLFVLLLFFTTALPAQQNLDSLKEVLKNEKDDSAVIARYLNLMETMEAIEQEPYLLIGNWALERSVTINNTYLITLSKLQLGYTYLTTSTDYTRASKYFTEALVLAEKNNFAEIELKAINGLAHMYFSNGQYDKAIEYNLRSIEGCKKNGFTAGEGAGYGSLGAIYMESSNGDPEKIATAIRYMQLSIEAFERIKDTFMLIKSYMSISKMLSTQQKYDTALYLLNTAGRMIEIKKREEDYAYFYFYKGTILEGKKNYKEAIENYQRGIEYSRKYQRLGFESSGYKGLSAVYKETGDYKQALYYFEKHKALEDSITNKENFAKATDIQNKYQREKKDKELLQKSLALKTESAKKNRLLVLLLSSLCILSFLSVFAFFLLKNIRARKKAYTQLQIRNNEIKEQALQLSRQARLIAKFQSQMNPHFTFNALHNIYGLVIGNENDKAISQIQSLAQLMRKTLTNSVKEEITLEEEVDYLQKYIDFEQAAAPVKFDFKIEIDPALDSAMIPPMMIQPLIENAIKHAGLDKVQSPFIRILMEKENDLMKLVIEDNGKGLNKENTNVNQLSHSLSIIKSRIELLFEGSKNSMGESYFKILSVPEIEKGTSIKFYLPLHYAY